MTSQKGNGNGNNYSNGNGNGNNNGNRRSFDSDAQRRASPLRMTLLFFPKSFDFPGFWFSVSGGG